MANSIQDREDFSTLTQLKEDLYVRAFVDPEPYKQPGTPERHEFWERQAARLEQSCQQAIKAIYLITGAFPAEESTVAKNTDPCGIMAIDYIVYDDAVLVIFECEQNPNRDF